MTSERLAWRERRRRCRARRDPFRFAEFVAPDSYDWSWHHALLYRELADFAAGHTPLLVVEAPPGHGKSEAVSRHLPAFLLGRNPDCRVLACSHTADLATEMSRDVQRLLASPAYRALFPDTRLAPARLATDGRQRSDLFDVAGRRGQYKAAGVGGAITGRRFDRGIIDDAFKDRAEADSPTRRDAVWSWYTSTFLTRAARGAGVCVMGARWHPDDLVGRLKARCSPRVLTLPALAEGDLHPADLRNPGEALWPWFKSAQALAELRELDPREFAALYQQCPRSGGDAEWPADYFDHAAFWFDEWPAHLAVKVLSLDPSKGTDSRRGDYSAFVKLGVAADGTEYVEADLRRDRDGMQIVHDGLRHVREFGPDRLACETNTFQQLFQFLFEQQGRAAGVGFTWQPVENYAPKICRIRNLTRPLALKRVRFKANSPGTQLLVQQLKDFPCADHDDGPDAYAQARQVALALWEGRP